MSAIAITPGRLRALAMIAQRGGSMHRILLGQEFIQKARGTPQAATRLAGFLCKPLVKTGLLREERDQQGFHVAYHITRAGREALGHA
jgi:DNA-binding MarR family transcriptional regulator